MTIKIVKENCRVDRFHSYDWEFKFSEFIFILPAYFTQTLRAEKSIKSDDDSDF